MNPRRHRAIGLIRSERSPNENWRTAYAFPSIVKRLLIYYIPFQPNQGEAKFIRLSFRSEAQTQNPVSTWAEREHPPPMDEKVGSGDDFPDIYKN